MIGPISVKTYEATVVFARLADAIEEGRFVEANRATLRLARLGYTVTYRKPRPARRDEDTSANSGSNDS